MPPGQTAALPRGFETSFCLASRPLIAHAVNSLDVGRAAVGFNLAANPADGGCQGVFVHKPFVYIPQLFQKLPAVSTCRGFCGTGSAFYTPSGIGSGACRLRKPSAPRSPETASRRRKCPWQVCGVPAWRTWL